LTGIFKRPWAVFAGMTVGYALIDGAAVAVGAALPGRLDQGWLQAGSGLVFILLGAASVLMGAEAERRAAAGLSSVSRFGPFLVSLAATAAGELGDRTQIASALLSAETGRPWRVFLGVMAALTLLNALTVRLGEALLGRLDLQLLSKVSGAAFILAGTAMLLRA
jgi:putative Ca2+/H+ antiporter (TMEM165/GDT1 family)